jgi:hypothetical protein
MFSINPNCIDRALHTEPHGTNPGQLPGSPILDRRDESVKRSAVLEVAIFTHGRASRLILSKSTEMQSSSVDASLQIQTWWSASSGIGP